MKRQNRRITRAQRMETLRDVSAGIGLMVASAGIFAMPFIMAAALGTVALACVAATICVGLFVGLVCAPFGYSWRG